VTKSNAINCVSDSSLSVSSFTNTLNVFKFDVQETLDIVRSTTDMSRYFTLEKNSLYSYPKCCGKNKVLEFWLGYKGKCEPLTLELGLGTVHYL
jgi:hypothetical protein